jgi:hypothetical protein
MLPQYWNLVVYWYLSELPILFRKQATSLHTHKLHRLAPKETNVHTFRHNNIHCHIILVSIVKTTVP